MTRVQKSVTRAGQWTVRLIGLAALLLAIWPTARAAVQSSSAQQFFATPEEAVAALRSATAAKDKDALLRIFGPQAKDLAQSGDPVEDAQAMARFAARLKEYSKLQKQSADTMLLHVGKLNWPMPIPLVRKNGQWYFDTAAGKEEILNRRIGRNELNAISVCHAYVEAQREYSKMNPNGSPGVEYAQRFMSEPGKKNGLYWPPVQGESLSPLGPLVAQAQAEGYTHKQSGSPPNGEPQRMPYHGYYYRILKSQGEHAPGGARDYLTAGRLTGGFALVAYPARWGESGVMTFIVNQDGKVYQKNLGEKTDELARQMNAYEPDQTWTPAK